MPLQKGASGSTIITTSTLPCSLHPSPPCLPPCLLPCLPASARPSLMLMHTEKGLCTTNKVWLSKVYASQTRN